MLDIAKWISGSDKIAALIQEFQDSRGQAYDDKRVFVTGSSGIVYENRLEYDPNIDRQTEIMQQK